MNRPEIRIQLMYLNTPYRHSAALFRRRFAILRVLYRRLWADFLQQRPDTWNILRRGFGVLCLTTNVKILSCPTVSTCEVFDCMGQIFNISESFVSVYFKSFWQAVCVIYGEHYLTKTPTAEELQQTFDGHASAGFHVALGCIYCMKLHWKNCRLSKIYQFLNN